MAKVLNCSLELNEIELQSPYYIHFRTDILKKVINLLISPAMGWIVSLLFFYKNSFGIY